MCKDHPWSLYLIEFILDKMNQAQRANIINTAFEGIFQNWTPGNVSTLLVIKDNFVDGTIDLPPTPILLKFMDRLIDDDIIWQDADNLYNVLDFLLIMNPESSRHQNKKTLQSQLLKLQIFTHERLEKLCMRANTMPKEFQGPTLQQKNYQLMYQEFIKLYSRFIKIHY